MQEGEELTFPSGCPDTGPAGTLTSPHRLAVSHFKKTGVSTTARASCSPNNGKMESLCLPKARPTSSLHVVQDFIKQVVFPLKPFPHRIRPTPGQGEAP